MFHTPAHKQADPAKLPGQRHFEPAAPYDERRRATLGRIEEAMGSIEDGCWPDGLDRPGASVYISPAGGGCLVTWLLGQEFYHALAATVTAHPRANSLSVGQLMGEARFFAAPYADNVGLSLDELHHLQQLYDSAGSVTVSVRRYIARLRDHA